MKTVFHDELDGAAWEVEHIDRAARFEENRHAMKAHEDAINALLAQAAEAINIELVDMREIT
jgi:hypothetical protein